MSTNALRKLIDDAHTLADPVPGKAPRLRWEWADAATTQEAPDELVEGVLVRGGASVMFGASNSSKTFAVVDIGAAIARGVRWFGRHTEPGLVVYLAAESPASIRTRLRAYRVAFDCQTPNFITVTSPVDLYGSNADMDEIVALIKSIEADHGIRCQLIVGDTLARMAAGANENSGEDMGQVIRRVDALREATGAHVLLIHHSGKDQTKGARGWSGIRAAVDTEIEITADDATGLRCLEITKQRDLPGKGDRIGFKLVQVNLGTTKWGKPFTSCVLEPAEAAPKQQKRKRESEIAGAITEYLAGGEWKSRNEIVEHFGSRHTKSAIYKQLRALTSDNRITEASNRLKLRPQE